MYVDVSLNPDIHVSERNNPPPPLRSGYLRKDETQITVPPWNTGGLSPEYGTSSVSPSVSEKATKWGGVSESPMMALGARP